jgi:hypothetical protein
MGFMDRIRIGATAGLAGALLQLFGPIITGQVPVEQAGNHISRTVVGLDATDNSWDLKRAVPFWGVLGGGIAVSAVAAKLKVNQYLPKGIKL